MESNVFDRPPYFDWSIDLWKVAIIVLLFILLLVGTLFDNTWSGTPARSGGPEMSDVAAVDEASVAGDATAGQSSEDGAGSAQPSAGAQRDSAALPLTLASLGPNAVVSPAGISSLSGTGQSVSRIEVRDQLIVHADVDQVPVPASEDALIGVAQVDERGLWNMPLESVLSPGQHIITLRELDEEGRILSVSSPAVVLVLDSGQQGPLSLATPVIRFPAPAARLRRGPTVFLGSGMPGTRVKLLLDGREVAEGVVNSREEWRLSPDEELAPGVYVARIVALDPQGKIISESPPVAFSVVEPVEGTAPDAPLVTPVASSTGANPTL